MAALGEANDLFGSDSDEETEPGIVATQHNRIADLIDENGKRLSQHPAAQVKLCEESPRYIGPIILENELTEGGGRGFTVAQDVSPGTLLLSEYPMILWKDLGIADGSGSDGVIFEVRVLKGILQRNDANKIINSMIPLYPEILAEYADQSVITTFRDDKVFVEMINTLPRSIIQISFDEALRIVLAIRSNAFASGLYPHFAMFNHSCVPNCIKYPPAKGELASEVRAIRTIRKGEPITVSYLEPREQSRIQRSSQLWGQFRFYCNCELCTTVKKAMLHNKNNKKNDSDQLEEHAIAKSSNHDGDRKDWWKVCDVNSLGVLALRQLITMVHDDPLKYENKDLLRKAAQEAQTSLLNVSDTNTAEDINDASFNQIHSSPSFSSSSSSSSSSSLPSLSPSSRRCASDCHHNTNETGSMLSHEQQEYIQQNYLHLCDHYKNASKLPSCATLLIVPKSIIHHWKQQISWYVDQNYLPEDWVYFDSAFDTEPSSLSSSSSSSPSSPSFKNSRHQTRLPSAEYLARRILVVLSTDRISSEFSKSSSIYRDDDGDDDDFYSNKYNDHQSSFGESSVSSCLLRIHWRRVVQDEGHSRGGSALTNIGLVMNELSAESRLIMSGTPLLRTHKDWLKQFQNLLVFLRHPIVHNIDYFLNNVRRPLEVKSHEQKQNKEQYQIGEEEEEEEQEEELIDNRLKQREKKKMKMSKTKEAEIFKNDIKQDLYCIALKHLATVVQSCLLRHDKQTARLQAPEFKVIPLTMGEEESKSYNAIVSFAKVNLVLTDMNGAVPNSGLELSLLHSKNKLNAIEMMKNIRITCVGGGKQVMSITPHNRLETQSLLRVQHGASEDIVTKALQFIDGATSQSTPALTPCAVCGLLLPLQLFTACGHFLCPECVTPNTVGCLAPDCIDSMTKLPKQPFPIVPRVLTSAQMTQSLLNNDDSNEDSNNDDDDDDMNRHHEHREVNGPRFRGDGLLFVDQSQSLDEYIDENSNIQIEKRNENNNDEKNNKFKTKENKKKKKKNLWSHFEHGVDAFANLQPGFDLHWEETLLEEAADGDALTSIQQRRRRELASSNNLPSPSIPNNHSRSSSSMSEECDWSTDLHVVQLLKSNTKARYIVNDIRNKLEKLNKNNHHHKRREEASGDSSDDLPLKVIVYSDFKKPLNVVGDVLVRVFGDDFVAQHWGMFRDSELSKFVNGKVTEWVCNCGYVNDISSKTCVRNRIFVHLNNNQHQQQINKIEIKDSDILGWFVGKTIRRNESIQFLYENQLYQTIIQSIKKCGKKINTGKILKRKVNCSVLLLSSDGVQGLDLSFVNVIYILNAILDPAAEKQLVSRAYRIGAKKPVEVIQLPMKGTIEELVLEYRTSSHGSNNHDEIYDNNSNKNPNNNDDGNEDGNEDGNGKNGQKKRKSIDNPRTTINRNFILENMRLLRGEYSYSNSEETQLPSSSPSSSTSSSSLSSSSSTSSSSLSSSSTSSSSSSSSSSLDPPSQESSVASSTEPTNPIKKKARFADTGVDVYVYSNE